MPVKITMNQSAIQARISGAFNKGLAFLSEEILNDCNEYCKMDTGTLIASSLTHSVPKEGTLVWQTPYARRQYWEIRTAIRDRGKPHASWKWCEVAKQNHLKQWEAQAQKAMGMNL